MSKEIVVKSSMTVKQSPGLKAIQYKAIAGVSEAELIERYTIGKFNEEDEEQDGEAESNTDRN